MGLKERTILNIRQNWSRNLGVEMLGSDMVLLLDEIISLRRRSHAIDAGEPNTGTSTTPNSASTCPDTGSVTEEMIDAGRQAAENCEGYDTECLALSVYYAMEAKKAKT